KTNVTGRSDAQVNDWLRMDLSMAYTYAQNDQPYKGGSGPLLGLLLWPATDNAKDYLSPAGQRRRLTTLAASSEVDNPYFNVNKNKINAKNSRIIANAGFILTPFSWGAIKSNIGTDAYTNQNLILKHPESAYGATNNGILENWDEITRALNTQTVLSINSRQLFSGLSISG